jgi:hypothetical protein
MNPEILEIYDLAFDSDGRCVVHAVVESAVVVIEPGYDTPTEWGPAMCRGTFYLSDEDVIPATDAGVRRMFSERIDDWEVVDTSDWADDS